VSLDILHDPVGVGWGEWRAAVVRLDDLDLASHLVMMMETAGLLKVKYGYK
jgi:hypothetical protein